MKRVRFSDWLERSETARARVERIERGFAEPYRRERPRDADEARFLRARGTPERLIGPVR